MHGGNVIKGNKFSNFNLFFIRPALNHRNLNLKKIDLLNVHLGQSGRVCLREEKQWAHSSIETIVTRLPLFWIFNY